MNRDRTIEETARGLIAASKAGWKVCDFALFMRPWIGEVRWDFPTWAVRTRPFDYLVDEADIPVPPSPPSWSVPERRQFDLYLRPAPPAVRHPFPPRWSA